MKEVILKLHNNKSPGIDGIIDYWFKDLNFYINDLVQLFNSILKKGHGHGFPEQEQNLLQKTLIQI